MIAHAWIVLAAMLASHSASGAATCPLSEERPMLVLQLYFGEDRAGRSKVSKAQWERFARTVLSAHFPDGFTVYDADGQWQDPKTKKIVREPSRVVVIAVDAHRDIHADVKAVTDVYKNRFRQQSVGTVTTEGCGAF